MSHSQIRPFPTIRRAGAFLCMTTLLVGCSPAQPEPEAPAPTTSQTAEESAPVEVGVWLLTGEETNEPVPEVISVKIENSPAARPQEGLEQADIVWEQLVEGGMTRFVAMFQSQLPQVVGPIRSIRPMDAAIAGPLGGILVFSGGQPEYENRITAANVPVASADGGHTGFYRNPARSGDHNLFGEMEEFAASLEGLPRSDFMEAEQTLFSFDVDSSAEQGGEPVGRIDLSFSGSSPSWEWSQTGGGRWERFESGVEAVAESGDRLSATNVIVIRVDIRDTGNRDAAGSMVPETLLVGEGEATVFSDGHMLGGRWEKGSDTEPLRLIDADGEQMHLQPGNTWVELVPHGNGSVETSGGL